jgi:hypothetical protein
MGLGFHAHPSQTRTPAEQFLRSPITAAKGVRNMLVRISNALPSTNAASRPATNAVKEAVAKAAAEEAAAKAAEEAAAKAAKAAAAKAAKAAAAKAAAKAAAEEAAKAAAEEQYFVYHPSEREAVRSRTRIKNAAMSTINVGGSNKKPVKKPLKKLVKKPVVKPAKKKVAVMRVRK